MKISRRNWTVVLLLLLTGLTIVFQQVHGWLGPLAGAYATQLAFLDALISSRLAAASYTAPPTAQNVRDAMKLAPSAGDPAAGSVDDHLDDVETKIDIMQAGTGSLTFTYTLTDGSTGLPIEGARVWAYSDEAMTSQKGYGVTSALGTVTLYLNAGTYYLKRVHDDYTFVNPDVEIVSS